MAKSESEEVVGRQREKQILDEFLDSAKPEFLAIYGRRRIGKTFLIREYCGPKADVFFSVTGQKDAPLPQQLFHFKQQLERVFYGGAPLPALRSWEAALSLLCDAVESLGGTRKMGRILLFFDELPWLASPRSRLLQALDHAWNTRLSRLSNVRVVVCGSAASWMLSQLIHAKGGLHNRITKRIHLEPMTLSETREFLHSRKVRLTDYQILEIYMALGGVPHYLAQVQKGRSAAQIIAALCFDPNGLLFDEFHRLFSSLFTNAALHEKIVHAIAKRRSGVLRDELLAALKVSSGGRIAEQLKELEEAGFIASLVPYGNKVKYTTYRVVDEYTAFYLKWIHNISKGALARSSAEDYWMSKSRTPAYRSWAGYAFEGVCLKHAPHIKRALGIHGISTETGTWHYRTMKGDVLQRGAQVDLLFDRADGVVNLCELKYSDALYQIDSAYAQELKHKLAAFQQKTGTKKNVFLTLVTVHGLKRNAWSEDLIHNVITAEALFKD